MYRNLHFFKFFKYNCSFKKQLIKFIRNKHGFCDKKMIKKLFTKILNNIKLTKIMDINNNVFSFRSDQNPFSSDQDRAAKWTMYSETDNKILEEAFQKYQMNEGPSEINLVDAKNYKVSFFYWNQISLLDPNKQRPVKRVENRRMQN